MAVARGGHPKKKGAPPIIAVVMNPFGSKGVGAGVIQPRHECLGEAITRALRVKNGAVEHHGFNDGATWTRVRDRLHSYVAVSGARPQKDESSCMKKTAWGGANMRLRKCVSAVVRKYEPVAMVGRVWWLEETPWVFPITKRWRKVLASSTRPMSIWETLYAIAAHHCNPVIFGAPMTP